MTQVKLATIGSDGTVGGPGGSPVSPQVASVVSRGPFLGLPVVGLHNHHTGPYGVVATTTCNARIQRQLCADVVEGRFVYVNWSGGEVSGVNPLTITAGYESPSGTILPVTFGGAIAKVLDIDGVCVTDPFPVDALSGGSVWERTHVSCSTSFPCVRDAIASVEGSETGAGLADKSLSGVIGVNSFPAAVYCASAFIGVTRAGVLRVWVALIGDSIPNGQGAWYESSYAIQALEAANIPFLSLTKGGETAQTYAALSTSRRRRQLSSSANYVLDQHSTNDVYSGRTLAQVQADKLTTWTAHANRGSKVFTQTSTARSTSSDGWTTVGNQGAIGGNAVRITYNAWIRDGSPIDATTKVAVAVGTSANVLRAGQAGHPLSVDVTYAPLGYIEIADVTESARDSGVLKAPGISGTGDISNGTNTILNATGAWAVGMIPVGVGIPATARVGTVAGSTLTLVDVTKQAVNCTATTVGLAIAASHSQDGIHPSPLMHSNIAAAVPTAIFV